MRTMIFKQLIDPPQSSNFNRIHSRMKFTYYLSYSAAVKNSGFKSLTDNYTGDSSGKSIGT